MKITVHIAVNHHYDVCSVYKFLLQTCGLTHTIHTHTPHTHHTTPHTSHTHTHTHTHTPSSLV